MLCLWQKCARRRVPGRSIEVATSWSVLQVSLGGAADP
jgi:hypothetical protein